LQPLHLLRHAATRPLLLLLLLLGTLQLRWRQLRLLLLHRPAIQTRARPGRHLLQLLLLLVQLVLLLLVLQLVLLLLVLQLVLLLLLQRPGGVVRQRRFQQVASSREDTQHGAAAAGVLRRVGSNELSCTGTALLFAAAALCLGAGSVAELAERRSDSGGTAMLTLCWCSILRPAAGCCSLLHVLPVVVGGDGVGCALQHGQRAWC
jgi:hypothetical protein